MDELAAAISFAEGGCELGRFIRHALGRGLVKFGSRHIAGRTQSGRRLVDVSVA